jgi:large repetitive protein
MIVLASLTIVVDVPLALGQQVTISYTDRGWYNELGTHYPYNKNYVVGDNRTNSFGSCCNDYRNFFVFDLAGVSQPIQLAKLALYVPDVNPDDPIMGPGYNSVDASENYELYNVETPIDELVAAEAGQLAIYADLSSGSVYGSRTMTAADIGSVVEITLTSSAISDMNATHALFAFGGSLTTLDFTRNLEFTFGNTNLDSYVTELRLTLVPEPSTLLLLAIGTIGLLAVTTDFRPVVRGRIVGFVRERTGNRP